MPFECPQEVINDYETLLENDEEFDVIIYSGENENVKEIHAHSLILRTRSQYFRTAFSKKWSEKKDGKFIFKKPNILPKLFKMILRFIYCGKIDLAELQGPEILKLLIAVDELNIQTLIDHIQEYLIKHQDEFLQNDPIGILETVYQHETFTDLWNFCLEKICEEPEILFNSDKFIRLKAPLLELLLKRDDLLLDEIVIWDGLIKWCLAQHSNISQDATRWDKEEITTMERTIHRFIPLIRFRHISSEDFIIKVYLFKEIIPKDLVNNILISHMAPNRQLNVDAQPPRQSKYTYDSILVEHQHFATFASWIDKKDNLHYNIRNLPYRFNLLYRASRDGNTVAAFHAKCDNKGATIVIVKIKNSEQIVGGYNPLHWESIVGDYRATKNAFIFSHNRKNIETVKVGYTIDERYSIVCNKDYGPIFGNGHDLIYHSNCTWGSNARNYPNINIPKSIDVEDYEVFQVIKK